MSDTRARVPAPKFPAGPAAPTVCAVPGAMESHGPRRFRGLAAVNPSGRGRQPCGGVQPPSAGNTRRRSARQLPQDERGRSAMDDHTRHFSPRCTPVQRPRKVRRAFRGLQGQLGLPHEFLGGIHDRIPSSTRSRPFTTRAPSQRDRARIRVRLRDRQIADRDHPDRARFASRRAIRDACLSAANRCRSALIRFATAECDFMDAAPMAGRARRAAPQAGSRRRAASRRASARAASSL
jgi:hypothetical protein